MELAERLQTIAPMRGKHAAISAIPALKRLEAAIGLAMAHTRRPYFIGWCGISWSHIGSTLIYIEQISAAFALSRRRVPVNTYPIPNPISADAAS